MCGKQTRQAAPPTSTLTSDVEAKKDLEEEAVEMLSSPPVSTLTGDVEMKKDLEEEVGEMLSSPLASTLTANVELKKDLEEEVAEMLNSPLPSHEEHGIQGQQHNLSEEETEGEGDIAFDISLDEGKAGKKKREYQFYYGPLIELGKRDWKSVEDIMSCREHFWDFRWKASLPSI